MSNVFLAWEMTSSFGRFLTATAKVTIIIVISRSSKKKIANGTSTADNENVITITQIVEHNRHGDAAL